MIHARPYAENDAPAWDAFCAQAHNATFLHTRRFLSYHGNRFADRSLVIEDDAGRWLGVLPAAVDPGDATRVVSHPGLTYGGLVHQGALRGQRMIDALTAVTRAHAALGHQRLLYKALPHIYHAAPAQDDLYALFRAGARRVRCDLSCCIDLAHPLPASERRRRGVKKAAQSGIRFDTGTQHAAALWPVLAHNLHRHGTQPVHSADEITLLAERFEREITFHVALLGADLVAGVVLFHCGTAVHAQYIAAAELGHEHGALDGLFDHVITQARERGARWFDFGISNEDQGRHLNDGLYRFKSEFGGGGVVHEFYDIDLS